MAPAEKVTTIFGATGNQGGSVARSLLQNPEFRVRAITRNLMSDVSQNLASHGAEVFQGNGFFVEEMIAAFQGSWGAFVNINSDDRVCLLLLLRKFIDRTALQQGLGKPRWSDDIRSRQDYCRRGRCGRGSVSRV